MKAGNRVRTNGGSGKETGDPKWWQSAVFYEIAPISFQDSNGDGWGDLNGLMRRLGYLQWLGVDALWLTPIYPSPFADLGYDISNYCDVDRRFGTLADFDRLVAALHGRGMRLILDFVPNHTAASHPWFEDSRSSRTDAKADWYVWADPAANGGPPNNWLSRFGHSAWTFEPQRGQYYYHAFLESQPDLNWRKPEVREAMANVLRFWLERGVDGFRMDAAAVLIEDALLRDEPPNPDFGPHTPPPERNLRVFTDDRPESLQCIEEMRTVLDAFQDRVLAGEVQGSSERIGRFYRGERPRLHLPLNFALLDVPFEALALQGAIDRALGAVPDGCWPDWVIGGHDKPRIASRIGQAQARLMAMLLMTLPGTPFLFAGDELGLEQASIPPDKVRDPFDKLVPGFGLGRDPERAPMPWDASRHAGFTAGEPWLPLTADADHRNVAALSEDETSILHLYRHLIALRRRMPALQRSGYQPVRARDGVLAYLRDDGESELLIALNLAEERRICPVKKEGNVLLSTGLDRGGAWTHSSSLSAFEGIIADIK